jgi:hypothetical protein
LTPPEIDATDLEELAGRAANQLDQGPSVRTFPGPRRNEQQKLLEVFIRPGRSTTPPRDDRAASTRIQRATAGYSKGFVIHK